MARAKSDAAVEETVLLALSGLSPAVLTESVWALAHEAPPLVPSRVVVLTTRRGREAICRDLLDSGAWDWLRHCLGAPASSLRFGPSADCIRLFPAATELADADDIATPEDSARAGDFILDALRQFTENPGVRVVFSVAGGRKTMTALGALAMTLLGRPGDRLCHVLVNPPFDNPALLPRFAFPDPAIPSYLLGGEATPGTEARITLCDIPYVRARRLFAEHLGALPGTFSTLVEQANRCVERAPAPPRLLLDPGRSLCSVDGVPVPLSTPEFVLLWLLCERARTGEGPIQGESELYARLGEFHARITARTMPEILHWDSGRMEEDGYPRRLASRLRNKMRKVCGDLPCWSVLDPGAERGHYGLRLPPACIEIRRDAP